MNEYSAFLMSKRMVAGAAGHVAERLHPALFPWQAEIVRWAVRKGRAALFEDCGLGKTIQQLAWAQQVPGDVLILTPLAVAEQTVAEAERFGIQARLSRDGTVKPGVTVTNYQQLHRFDLGRFTGLVLDESSILKAHDGATRTAIIEAAQTVPYRLACTATPAPNDHTELANHAAFLGLCTRGEMLACYFTHDGGDTSKWRLKRHAVADFWAWVATWAVMVRTPADIGHTMNGYVLPALRVVHEMLDSGLKDAGELFALPATDLISQRKARRQTLSMRVEHLADVVNRDGSEPWVVWCELNDEAAALAQTIHGAVEVSGADDDDSRRAKLVAFSRGEARVLVTKPKVAGWGMNWQHCARVAFVGLSHSWEQYYQAVRRCWRFGQQRPVDVHIVATDVELAVLRNIERKQAEADKMANQMVGYMRDTMRAELDGAAPPLRIQGEQRIESGDGWTMRQGDCVEEVKALADSSVHYTVYSPPFASLYTYSDDPRDMGNCANDDAFFAHLAYLLPELYRVTMPGRLMSFHCMDLPMLLSRDGMIGLRDFRGDLIRAAQKAGWVLHSQVVIWKDPVTAMQRTKALGLLHKQLKKDSCMSRQGIPDYLVTMRKPGDNPEPVTHTDESFPVSVWQRYASPIWMDINPSDTLQYRSARQDEDERHICPLQLQVIRRALELWSNPGDLVLSPFAGIGSEGVVALEMDRRFVGVELKQSYFEQAVANLRAARAQQSLGL